MNRSGLTLIETVVSLAVVSLLLAAALNTTGSAATTRALAADRRVAEELCNSLMTEILKTTYLDPDTGLDGTGPAEHEVSATHRLLFDDVDDFNGWNKRPAVERDGSAIPAAKGLRRKVSVTRFSNSGGASLYTWAGEVKIVAVEVSRNQRILYALTAVRHRDWDRRRPVP